MSLDNLTLEERVQRLEGLFSFTDTSVTLKLSNGFNSVTLSASKDNAYLSVCGKNYLFAAHSEEAMCGFGLYNIQSGDKPVVYFLTDSDGDSKIQYQVNGQAFITSFGITLDAQEISEPAEPENTSPVHKPRG